MMTGLPPSLSIAIWLVGAICLVAVAAHAFDAPREMVYAIFGVGLVTGLAEWLAAARHRR